MNPNSRTSDDRIVGVAAPLRKEVVKRLRDAIANFELEPGDRIVEAALSVRYGVSRTVIREAVRQLEADGIVKMIPNRGPIVASVSRSEAKALYEVRGALEALAGRLFALRATEEECRRLTEALDALEIVRSTEPLPAVLKAKDEFYDALIEGAHNEILAGTLRALHARVNVLRNTSPEPAVRQRQTLVELAEVVKAAVIDRDPENAARMCELHVQMAFAPIERMFSRLAEGGTLSADDADCDDQGDGEYSTGEPEATSQFR